MLAEVPSDDQRKYSKSFLDETSDLPYLTLLRTSSLPA